MGNVTNVREVKMALRQKRTDAKQRLRVALIQAGLLIQRESQLLVPVDTAALRNSANTRAIDGKGYVEVIVSYGTEYGIYVHENLDAHHDVGQAKFLEQPFRELRSDILQMVKDAING
jgi:hypothetical protein